MSNTAPTGNDVNDIKKHKDIVLMAYNELNLKWLPVYIWRLMVILGFALTIYFLLTLAGVFE